MTPEGRIKFKIKKLLSEFNVYVFMPVQAGFGPAGLDFHCMFPGGMAFYIEAKAPDKKPTLRQEALIDKLRKLGAKVFVISSDVTLAELEDWLNEYARPAKR